MIVYSINTLIEDQFVCYVNPRVHVWAYTLMSVYVQVLLTPTAPPASAHSTDVKENTAGKHGDVVRP